MTTTTNAKPTLLLFDVYETLLDMSAVEKKVNMLLDNKRGYFLWFELFMQYCFVENCIKQFNPFPEIASTTARMAGNIFIRTTLLTFRMISRKFSGFEECYKG